MTPQQLKAMKLALEALKNNKLTHLYCEDTWYSCPKHEDGCANEAQGDKCNCGADEINAEFDKSITALEEALAEHAMQEVQRLGQEIEQCQCPECQIKPHASDCAVHSEPAYPKGKCDCGAQPQQEPHGWYIDGYGAVIGTAEPKSVRVGEWLPWYTTPPQRKPLLASEIVTMYAECPTSDNDMIEFARAIEAAHGIKGGA
jgi:hypothetical protein